MTSRRETFTDAASPGVELCCVHWGDPDASPLVLLHGGGANAHWWDHLAPDLAERFHVVALDFRGHGDSTYPEALEVGAFNVDLEALLARLGDRPPVIVGHSMGAHVALDHASHHPNVAALIVIDPARGGARRSRRAARLALALRRTYASREEAIDRFRFVPAAEHVSEPLRLHIARHSVREEEDGRFGFKFDPRWFSVASRPPPDLSAIACPTLVVRGSESALLTEEGGRELAREIPLGEAISVEGAGHHVLLDRPKQLQLRMREWLLRTKLHTA